MEFFLHATTRKAMETTHPDLETEKIFAFNYVKES